MNDRAARDAETRRRGDAGNGPPPPRGGEGPGVGSVSSPLPLGEGQGEGRRPGAAARALTPALSQGERERTDALSQGERERSQNRVGFFGVEGIDDLIPRGISYDTQVMVQGDTGIGKSVLAAQFLYEGLLVGDNCVCVACDEPPQVMRENMANLRLGTLPYERTGQLVFIDAYTRERSRERHFIPDPGNFDEFLLYQKRVLDGLGNAPTRLVVDSLSTVLSTAATADILEFGGHRLRYLRARQALTMDIFVGGVMEQRAVAGLSHLYPMILKMEYVSTNGMLQRYLQLGKLKSGQFTSVMHQFSIDSRTGIVVQPAR